MESQGGRRFPAGLSVSPPTPGCLPVLATSVQSSLCPSPPLGVGVGVLFCFWCLVFLLPHVSWQALTSVAVGQRECSGAAKVGGDSGWLIPDEGAPSSLSPVSVLRSHEELPRPDSASPPPVSRVCPAPPLAPAAAISTDCGRRRGCPRGGRPWKSGSPRFGFQLLSQAPGARGPLGAWG